MPRLLLRSRRGSRWTDLRVRFLYYDYRPGGGWEEEFITLADQKVVTVRFG